MQEFGTDREALNFLADKIAAEAERENLPLSEVERKMLYFSETDWTLPDMKAVSAKFDQDYNQDEYEQKIAGLIGKITAHRHSHSQNEEELWDAAVEKLSGGDHYLLVMIDAAHSTGSSFLPTLSPPAVRPPHDRLKLLLAACGVLVLPFVLAGLISSLFGIKYGAVVDWLFDRNTFGLFVLGAVIAWFAWNVFGDALKNVADTLLRRKRTASKPTRAR